MIGGLTKYRNRVYVKEMEVEDQFLEIVAPHHQSSIACNKIEEDFHHLVPIDLHPILDETEK